jgi:hypothetical protein
VSGFVAVLGVAMIAVGMIRTPMSEAGLDWGIARAMRIAGVALLVLAVVAWGASE